MNLLLGSGTVIQHFATKLIANDPTNVYHFGPIYYGPVDAGFITTWHAINDESDAALLEFHQDTPLLFTKVAIGLPECSHNPSTLLDTFDFTDYIKTNLTPYLYILNTKVSQCSFITLFCECKKDSTYLSSSLINSCVQPLICGALQNKKSTIRCYMESVIVTKPIDEWFTLWNGD